MINWKTLYIILIIAFALFFTYLPHIEYKLPLHVDEWNAIGDAQSLQDGTYTAGLTALRFGFHVFLSALPFDLIQNYHILPALWNIIGALILFFILEKKLKIQWALVASFLFITIKSTNATLGHWFFTPLIFSIPLLFLLHYCYLKLIEKRTPKHILYVTSLCIVLLFTYPIALIFYGVTAFFTFTWTKLINKRKEFMYLVGGLGFFSIVCFLIFIFILKENPLFIVLNLSLIPTDWFQVNHLTHPNQILTWFGIITTLVGTGFIIKRPELRKAYLHELSWLIVGIVWITIAYLTKYSLFVPLERLIFFTAIITPVFGAIGLRSVYEAIPKNILKSYKLYFIVGLCLLILICVKPFFFDYSLSSPGRELYYAATEDEFDFITSLNLTENDVVLSPVYTSLVFQVATDANTVIHPPFIHDDVLFESVVTIYLPVPCDAKNRILEDIYKQSAFTRVYSKTDLSCLNQSIELIATSGESYVYTYIT